MLSFWERKHLLEYDLIVVGAGIVGLSVAIQFKEKHPESGVLVLERGIFPSGASTKNAGFACFGSLTEILDDLESMPKDEVLNLIRMRYEGLKSIREVFGDGALGYEASGGFELFSDDAMSALSRIPEINELLFPLFGREVFERLDSIEQFGFSGRVLAVVKNSFEGELDTGNFFLALWQRCLSLDIKILTGADVIQLDRERIHVTVANTVGGQSIVFSGGKIAVCTNAFSKRFFPELDVKPGRGMVMVTKPLPQQISWRGSFHFDRGYVYFRQVDGRLLIGGGRNLDVAGEQTTEMGLNPRIRQYLGDLISTTILPNKHYEIDFEWSGIMAFGENKKPIVRLVSPNVGVAVRLGGMGVAIGWHTAGELVGLLDKHEVPKNC